MTDCEERRLFPLYGDNTARSKGLQLKVNFKSCFGNLKSGKKILFSSSKDI